MSSTAAPTPSCSSPSCPLPRSRYAAAAGSGAGRRREVFLALTYSLPHRLEAHRTGRDGMRERIEATCRFWMDWSSACTYEGPYRDEGAAQHPRPQGPHQHSTGAIVAAPTMSLPEELGGVRNWDYRYSWLRDAALNLYTLFSLGYTEEAHAFIAWVERTTAGRAEGSADHVRRGRRAPPPRDRARCPRRVQELEPDAHRQRCCRAVHSTSTPTSSTPPGSTTAPAGRSPLPSGACSPGW